MTDPDRILSAAEIVALSRILWSSEFTADERGQAASHLAHKLGRFLGINQRNAQRLLAGTMRANAGVSQELLAELRRYLLRSDSPMAYLIREALA